MNFTENCAVVHWLLGINYNLKFNGNSKCLILYLKKLFFNSKFDTNHF